MLIFKKESDPLINAISDTHLMLFGGDTLKERRHIWWNFVSSSKERIEKAKVDWQEAIKQNFQNTPFKQAPDEEEFIPLPEEASGPPKSTKECPTT